jgi:CRP-like cAMP-binding protein
MNTELAGHDQPDGPASVAFPTVDFPAYDADYAACRRAAGNALEGAMANPEPFLSQIDAADRAALEARWTVHRHEAEEMIVAHDEAGRDVFFVLEGHARATVFSSGGRAIAYRDIEPGDIFGELAAIDGRTRSASIVAHGTMSVARLPAAGFRDLVNSRPDFTWALLRHLSSQMRRMTDRIYEFNTLVVRKRLVRELLRLAEQGQSAGKSLLISPAPTHFDLAAMISTHREAVSRAMSALAKEGLIEKRGRSIVLCAPRELRAIAEAEE